MVIFFGWMPKMYIFLAAQTKQILFELAPAVQVIKKLKMDHLWVSMLYPTPCCNCYRMCLKKAKKRACQFLKFWIHVLVREINILLKFHVKIKFWSKVTVHEIRGTNFGTPCNVSFARSLVTSRNSWPCCCNRLIKAAAANSMASSLCPHTLRTEKNLRTSSL